MTLNVEEVPDRLVMSYYRKEGWFAMTPGSTETVTASAAPVFLRIENPVTGQPFALGSVQEIFIEVFVVDMTRGAGNSLGYRQA
jgi:hypothetical protein